MTKEMSKLQTELNFIKLKENEAQDQINHVTKQLEAERQAKLSPEGLKLKVCSEIPIYTV